MHPPDRGSWMQLPTLGENDVRLFFACTNPQFFLPISSLLWQWISEAERSRYYRYVFEKDRSTFLLGRGLLRYVVGHYSGQSPQQVVFSEGRYGRLFLDRTPELSFNLSHSHEVVCIAISRSFRVGVDIEFSDPFRAQLDIADQFFTMEECSTIRSSAPDERHLAFFRLWTLKEAYIKCIGKGLSIPLNSFQFRFSDQGIGIDFMRRATDAVSHWDWRFHSWRCRDYSVGLAISSEARLNRSATTTSFRMESGLSFSRMLDSFR